MPESSSTCATPMRLTTCARMLGRSRQALEWERRLPGRAHRRSHDCRRRTASAARQIGATACASDRIRGRNSRVLLATPDACCSTRTPDRAATSPCTARTRYESENGWPPGSGDHHKAGSDRVSYGPPESARPLAKQLLTRDHASTPYRQLGRGDLVSGPGRDGLTAEALGSYVAGGLGELPAMAG